MNRLTVTLEDLAADSRERLLAAEPGHVLGPLRAEDDQRFDVAKLISRTPPEMTDPAIVDRAREQLVAHTLQRAAREHVRRTHGDMAKG